MAILCNQIIIADNIFEQISTTKQRMQQLKQAIKYKDMNKIKLILSYPNASQIVNSRDKQQQTPLFHAGLHDDQDFGLQVVNMLLQKGADPYHKQDNQETVLYYLTSNNKVKVLERMLELGFNLNENDKYGQTPLFFAAQRGRLKCAQLLIKNGNNVNHVDNNVQTCLFYAAREGHLQMCKQLINRGCNPLLVDKYKKTAATYAKAKHHSHVVDYLILFKKQKNQQKMKSNSQSMQMQKKRKKQTHKNQHFLVFTGQDGQTHPLSQQQVQEFLKNNQMIKEYLQDPQQLQPLTINQSNVPKACSKILTLLLKRQDTIIFHQPVKWQEFKLVDYPSIVKDPMDYTTMKSKLAYNCYKTQEDFTRDIHLVYANCIKYNGPDGVYGKLAEKLKQQYDTLLREEFDALDL